MSNIVFNEEGKAVLIDMGCAATPSTANIAIAPLPTKIGTLDFLSPQRLLMTGAEKGVNTHDELTKEDVYQLAQTIIDSFSSGNGQKTGTTFTETFGIMLPRSPWGVQLNETNIRTLANLDTQQIRDALVSKNLVPHGAGREDMLNLLTRMLSNNPSERPSMQEVAEKLTRIAARTDTPVATAVPESWV